jgi:GxxExxY protein
VAQPGYRPHDASCVTANRSTERTEPTETSGRRDDPETGAIIRAALHVHIVLGPGFLEAVYQAALARELERRGIPFQREASLPVWYDGEWLDVHYRVDFACGDILVELKALPSLSGVEESQIINYLHARRGGRGLLLNFGAGRLEIRRFVV